MTDLQYKALLERTMKAKVKYFSLRKRIEKEYEKRIGAYPGDIDDDNFIDRFHYPGNYDIDVNQIMETAKDRYESAVDNSLI